MAKGGKGGIYFESAPQVTPPKDIPVVNIPGPQYDDETAKDLEDPHELPPDIGDTQQLIVLKKELYGAVSFNNNSDRGFKDFSDLSINRNISQLFQIYNDNFYDIPKSGSESHTELMLRSEAYLTNFIDPRDEQIEELTGLVSELEVRVLDLELSGAAAIGDIGAELVTLQDTIDETVDALTSELDDLSFSQYEPSYYLPRADSIAEEGLRAYITDGANTYYKPDFYGKQIYSLQHNDLDGGAKRYVVKIRDRNRNSGFGKKTIFMVVDEGQNGNVREAEVGKAKFDSDKKAVYKGSTADIRPEEEAVDTSGTTGNFDDGSVNNDPITQGEGGPAPNVPPGGAGKAGGAGKG